MRDCTKDRDTIDSDPAETSEQDHAPDSTPMESGALSFGCYDTCIPATTCRWPFCLRRNPHEMKVMVFMDDEVWINGRRLREWKEDW